MVENISEKRLVNRLQNYWHSIRGGKLAPPFSKFNRSAISDMWENCIHLTVINKTEDEKANKFKVEYMGNLLKEAFVHDLKGQYLSETDRSILPGSGFANHMEVVLREKVFNKSEGQFINAHNKIVKYRDCILPVH
jgi:hypothetical protein